jgi:hypothetical protein
VPESEIDRGSQTLIVSLRIAPGAFWRDLFLTTSRLTAFFNKFLVGHRVSSESNQQYIVTMNSDIFDRLPLPDDFDRSSIVLPVRISDETETGGLFGFRFG